MSVFQILMQLGKYAVEHELTFKGKGQMSFKTLKHTLLIREKYELIIGMRYTEVNMTQGVFNDQFQSAALFLIKIIDVISLA